ncbi:MAG: two-component regulator propeller domain-containing protein, partial [Bacteroidota bacterium]
MPSSEIYSMVQDGDGFIWLSSWGGLWRFDGYTNKPYTYECSHQHKLKTNQINCLFLDHLQRLWVGTYYEGFFLYDKDTDSFIQFFKEDQGSIRLKSNNVLSIGEDENHLLWIGTDEGLSCFDPEKKVYLAFDESKTSDMNAVRFFSSALSEDRILWVGGEQGLERLVKGKNGQADHFVHYNIAPKALSDLDPTYARHNVIRKIIPSKIFPNTLWIETQMGIKKLSYQVDDRKQLTIQSINTDNKNGPRLSHNSVSDILEDEKRKGLWIATFNGLNFWDFDKEKIEYFFHDPKRKNSIANNVINSLFLDRSDYLWINTDEGSNRINFINEAKRQVQVKSDHRSIERVTSFTLSRERDGYWMGTNGTGICFVPSTDGVPNHQPTACYSIKTKLSADYSGFISDLIVSTSGDLWLTTEGAGIIRIKESDIPIQDGILTDVQQYTQGTHPVNDYPIAVFESQDGGIWFGYWDAGIGRYDPIRDTFTHFDFTDDLQLNLRKFPVFEFGETQEKGELFLWLGTGGAGLLKVKYDKINNSISLAKNYQLDKEVKQILNSSFIYSIDTYPKVGESKSVFVANDTRLNHIDLQTDSITLLNDNLSLEDSLPQSVKLTSHELPSPMWMGQPLG